MGRRKEREDAQKRFPKFLAEFPSFLASLASFFSAASDVFHDRESGGERDGPGFPPFPSSLLFYSLRYAFAKWWRGAKEEKKGRFPSRRFPVGRASDPKSP